MRGGPVFRTFSELFPNLAAWHMNNIYITANHFEEPTNRKPHPLEVLKGREGRGSRVIRGPNDMIRTTKDLPVFLENRLFHLFFAKHLLASKQGLCRGSSLESVKDTGR